MTATIKQIHSYDHLDPEPAHGIGYEIEWSDGTNSWIAPAVTTVGEPAMVLPIRVLQRMGFDVLALDDYPFGY